MIRSKLVFPVLCLLPFASGACGDSGGGSGDATESATTSPTGPTSNTQSTTDDTSASTSMETGATESSTDSDTGNLPPCPYEPVAGTPQADFQLVAEGFQHPVFAIGDPEVPDRLFVVEQVGNVKILEPGETIAPGESFLQVGVSHGGGLSDENGLLGFALHPDFPADPRVYVNYNPDNAPSFRTRIEEYTLDPGNPNQVDPGSARTVLEIDQPAGNHNGGMILFGPDDYMYIGMGDGGGGEDAFGTSRAPQFLLAKILRIGVDPDGTNDMTPACSSCDTFGPFDYTIPADNPFVDDPQFAPEVYAWGVRNPWRMAFDGNTLYAGDVGQYDWEEISVIEAGRDYGWNSLEGFHCGFMGPCDDSAGPGQANSNDQVAPLVEYGHGLGSSVTGGSVYRSCEVDAWDGLYFYSDWGSGRLWALVWDGNELMDLGEVGDTDLRVSGNGWNAWGDVYFTAKRDAGFEVEGFVYRIAPAP